MNGKSLLRVSLAAAAAAWSVALAGCGGGSRPGTAPQTPQSVKTAPPGELTVSPSPSDSGDRLVYRLELPEPGRTAAAQIELEYDPAALKIVSASAGDAAPDGLTAMNDYGDGRLTVAVVNARVLKQGGALVEIEAASNGGAVPENALRIAGYELTNVEGKPLTGRRRPLSRVASRTDDVSAPCWLQCGDVNGDAAQSAADATLALRAAVGLDDADYQQTCAGDVAPLDNPDGTFSAADATLMLRKTVGLSVFGCGTEGSFVARSFDAVEVAIDALSGAEKASDEVLVLFNDGTEAETIDEIASANGLETIGRNSETGAWQFKVDPDSQESVKGTLASNPNVAAAEDNAILKLFLTPNDPNFSGGSSADRWGYEKIKAKEAWDLQTGSGEVVIAIVDTGVDATHPEFSGRIVQGYDFANGDSDPRDDNGHGTHVAGIAAGKGNNGVGMAGGCWNCKIMPVKVLTAEGSGTLYGVMNGISWAAKKGAGVINLSLGGALAPGQTEIETIRQARSLGSVVIVSAGNDSSNASNYTPAGVAEAVTVASTNQSDLRSYFSNYGSVVDIAAPGSGIYSTMPTYPVYLTKYAGQSQNYDSLSGTSMAAPMVAGVAGLVRSANPTLSVSEVETILKTNIDAISPDKTIGTGRLNALKSVQAAQPGGGNQSPTVSLSSDKSSGAAPLTVNFTASCTDADGSCVSISWNYGDLSQTATTTDKSRYTYVKAGTYTVSVIVIDDKGGKGTASKTITVTQPASNQPPSVSLAADKTSGTAPLTVNFNAICADSDGTCKYFLWDFGDLSQKNVVRDNAAYTFKSAGTYKVKVRVVDDDGAEAEDDVSVTATSPAGNQPPQVTVSADVTNGVAPLTVTFTGTAFDPDGNISSMWWNFGDFGSNAVTQKPTHVYEYGGTYTATLTAVDEKGQTGKADITITVTSGGGTSGNPWITIPAGNFIMGCAATDTQCNSDESPKHTVYLSAYKIQKYEVTNAQYKQCVDAGACTVPSSSSSSTRPSYYGNAEFDDYPVVYVNWNRSKTYCEWIGGRLPTEAEWEKAARGPSPRENIYPWGDAIDGAYANYWDSGDPYDNDTTPVGYYPSGTSYYGAMDMTGNVWEWVNDWYDSTYYSSSPSSAPQGPPTGSYRVLRGGSWFYYSWDLRASLRGFNPSYSNYFDGFRCAQDF